MLARHLVTTFIPPSTRTLAHSFCLLCLQSAWDVYPHLPAPPCNWWLLLPLSWKISCSCFCCSLVAVSIHVVVPRNKNPQGHPCLRMTNFKHSLLVRGQPSLPWKPIRDSSKWPGKIMSGFGMQNLVISLGLSTGMTSMEFILSEKGLLLAVEPLLSNSAMEYRSTFIPNLHRCPSRQAVILLCWYRCITCMHCGYLYCFCSLWNSDGQSPKNWQVSHFHPLFF